MLLCRRKLAAFSRKEERSMLTAVLVAVDTIIALIRTPSNVVARTARRLRGSVGVVAKQILEAHVVLCTAREDVICGGVLAAGLPILARLDAPAAFVLEEIACCVRGHRDAIVL